MTKEREQTEPRSCFNKAEPCELMFVILARDAAAPATIAAWITKRVQLGLNKPDDPQILEASQLMRDMVAQYESREHALKTR